MNIQSVTAAYGAQAFSPAKGAKKAAPEKVAAAPNEQVELSDTSLNLQKIRDAVDAEPDVRIKLVEEIRTKIRYNGYPLESNLYKAVEKMLDNRIV
jgi:anti-sigma28 factor (negative regulator of flagellin synthesis)